MSANLLDTLKKSCAAGIDALRAIAERYGTDAEVTIIISHPGTAEDAFMVGQHEIADIYAILQRLETGPAVASDVSSTFVGVDEPMSRSSTQ